MMELLEKRTVCHCDSQRHGYLGTYHNLWYIGNSCFANEKIGCSAIRPTNRRGSMLKQGKISGNCVTKAITEKYSIAFSVCDRQFTRMVAHTFYVYISIYPDDLMDLLKCWIKRHLNERTGKKHVKKASHQHNDTAACLTLNRSDLLDKLRECSQLLQLRE